MLRQTSLLVSLVRLIDRLPWPPEPAQRPRGRPKTSSDRLMVKALVIMIMRRLYTAYALLTFLEQEDAVARQLRPLLTAHDRVPTRRTWERRLTALPSHLPGLMGCFGRHLVNVFSPWAHHGRAVVVGSVWIPLAAELTAAHTADNEVAPLRVAPLPAEVSFILGDTHDHDPSFRTICAQSNRILVATRRAAHPHHDGGVEVRRIFHKLRSQAIEPFNGRFKKVFEGRTQMPVKGLHRSQLLALGAMLIYPLVLLYQHEQAAPVGKGIKALLRAA
jgi:hypothetical protein